MSDLRSSKCANCSKRKPNSRKKPSCNICSKRTCGCAKKSMKPTPPLTKGGPEGIRHHTTSRVVEARRNPRILGDADPRGSECLNHAACNQERIMSKEVVYIGMDLGTFKTSVASSTGLRDVLQTAVGWPRDHFARTLLGRDVVFGKDLIEHRLALKVVRPFEKGVFKYNSIKECGLRPEDVENAPGSRSAPGRARRFVNEAPQGACRFTASSAHRHGRQWLTSKLFCTRPRGPSTR